MKLLILLLLIPLSAVQAQFEAKRAFQQGHYEQAILQWQAALASSQKTSHRLASMFGIARAYQWIGAYDKALATLNTALPIAAQTGNTIYHALLLNELSKLRLSQAQKWEKHAIQSAEKALSLARQTNNPLILAEILKHRGHLLTTDYDYEGALAAYREALIYTQKISPFSKGETLDSPFSKEEIEALHGKILISLAQTTFLLEKDNAYQYDDKQQAFKSSIAAVKRALAASQNETAISYSQTFALINLSQLAQNIQAQLTQPEAQLTRLAYQALIAARHKAERLNNAAAKAYVYGNLGQLYEGAKRYDEALNLTRQAVFFAQQTAKLPFLYVWQWQLGRIKKAQGDKDGAIVAYQQAIKNLQPIRRQLASTGYLNITKTFREQFAPIYFELADLLLSQAALSRDKLLRQAIETIEDFKKAELQDYFQSDCFAFDAECSDLETILDAQTAILYPIVLPDRLELLLQRADGLIQATVPIGEKILYRQIISFVSPLHHHPNPLARQRAAQKSNIEDCSPSLRGRSPPKASARTFLEPAQTLYSWLIKPLIPQLQDIKTLVIVPDGALRTIPFAALHDGQQYLIQKYALATEPTLCLSTPQKQSEQNTLLLSGLSEAVQGFSSLPCAEYELETLRSLYKTSEQPLLNDRFTLPNLQRNIKKTNYSIVHIASHGQFSANLENTFILTYDDKLSMDKLEELITLTKFKESQTVELLTLSACETAVGDERAALGLAGIALKAGVKTTLASLWKIDDEATPAVVIEFYRQLQKPGISKAVALQNAMKLMLTEKHYVRYRHPYYWAAFLLIGDWF
jgi:CHAT domain-containing protein